MLSFVVRVLAFTEDLPCVETYGGDADFRATFGGQPEPGAGKGRSRFRDWWETLVAQSVIADLRE